VNCRKCHKPMIACTDNGKPGFVCLPCGSTVALPMAGSTTPHFVRQNRATPTNTRPGPQNAPECHVGPGNGIVSEGEARFSELWTDLHPDFPFVREYEFSLVRNWRIDFAFVSAKVAVEYEGFGHGRSGRYGGDIDKYNAMASEGWLLLRCTKAIMEDERKAEKFCRMVMRAIARRDRI
jgi:very-short-patch-repair endonuclease